MITFVKITLLQNTPNEALIILARFVKRVRIDREIKVEELASRVGVSRSTILRFEKTGAGSTESLVKIFSVLGVLDSLTEAFVPPVALTIAELKKNSNGRPRQRVRSKSRGIS